MDFPQVASAVQQVGFKRVKRYGRPVEGRLEAKRRDAYYSHGDDDEAAAGSSDPWSALRQALDEEAAREAMMESDFHVVHDENYFNRMQHSANTHR